MTVPNLANPIFPIIYAGAEISLAEEGYALVIGSDSLMVSDSDDEERIEEVNEILRSHYVDGWILTDALKDGMLPEIMSNERVPAVLVNRTADRIAAPSIVPDHYMGIELILKHLFGLGHKAIAHIAGPENVSTGVARREAFIDGMHAQGLETPNALTVHAGAFLTGSGRVACEALLDSGEHFTAIVAGNDLIALGCYDALAARGIDVPGSVSVTGFDDMAFIDRVHPPLTTVSVPYYEMGVASGKIMLGLLTGSEVEAASNDDLSTRLPPSIVIRSSTAPPKPSGH